MKKNCCIDFEFFEKALGIIRRKKNFFFLYWLLIYRINWVKFEIVVFALRVRWYLEWGTRGTNSNEKFFIVRFNCGHVLRCVPGEEEIPDTIIFYRSWRPEGTAEIHTSLCVCVCVCASVSVFFFFSFRRSWHVTKFGSNRNFSFDGEGSRSTSSFNDATTYLHLIYAPRLSSIRPIGFSLKGFWPGV